MTPAPTATPEQSVDEGLRPGRAFRVLAIDPGPVESAYVVFDGERVLMARKKPNLAVLAMCMYLASESVPLIVEQIASFGMPVGAEVFETVFWSGRFTQGHQDRYWSEQGPDVVNTHWHRVKRHDIKLHLCKSARANDSTIRQALIDRFGGKERAIGRKKSPGPLYGIVADQWSALALAVTWFDQHVASARCQSGAEAGG